MWPSFEEFKVSLENWLKSNHPDYLKDFGGLEWANTFTGKHHSMVIIANYNKVFNLNN